MNKTITLVGYEVFTSKNGKLCTLIHTESPISKRDSHSECAGKNTASYFVSEQLRTKVSISDIGKDITIYTNFHDGKEHLQDIIK